MSSLVNINGNEIKEKNGEFYINGERVVNNTVSGFKIKASTFIAGFILGAVFIVALAEFGKVI
jgi:hypothetical protein